MESMDPKEQPGEIIYPRQVTTRQRFVLAGERTENDPALIPCNGTCGKQHVKWTWHFKIATSQYRCGDCSTTRKWGLGGLSY
jgi:hypothetical protein